MPKRTLFSLYSLGSNNTKNHSRADSKLQCITHQNRNSFIKRYFFYQGFGKPELNSGHMYTIGNKITFQNSVMLTTVKWRELRLKCDGTHAETRFRLSAKWTSPFKSAGASVQSTTGSQGVRISGSNAGYIMFWGSVSPSPPRLCVTVCHHISTGLLTYNVINKKAGKGTKQTRHHLQCQLHVCISHQLCKSYRDWYQNVCTPHTQVHSHIALLPGTSFCEHSTISTGLKLYYSCIISSITLSRGRERKVYIFVYPCALQKAPTLHNRNEGKTWDRFLYIFWQHSLIIKSSQHTDTHTRFTNAGFTTQWNSVHACIPHISHWITGYTYMGICTILLGEPTSFLSTQVFKEWHKNVQHTSLNLCRWQFCLTAVPMRACHTPAGNKH